MKKQAWWKLEGQQVDKTMKVIDSVYFTPMGGDSIGIVLCETSAGSEYGIGKIAFIGHARVGSFEGDNAHIAKTGAKFPMSAANALFTRTLPR